MIRQSRRLAGVAALVLIGATVVTCGAGRTAGALTAPRAAAPSAPDCPWLSTAQPVATRVSELLAAMTLQQQVSMVNLQVASGYENVTPAIPSLCIPKLVLQDGSGGITAGAYGGPGGTGTATQLPAPVDLAASFDPQLARDYGEVLGVEALAKGVDVVQAPDVNIARVPQAGRDFEVFGEDPLLTAQTAVAEIDGIQSTGEMSMVKHFVAYNQETGRATEYRDDSIVSPRALAEIYFPAFQAAVQEARVASVMCSYNMVDGVGACQDASLISDVLDTQWGFAGFVRSDLGAVWDEVAALSSGLDQFKPAAATAILTGIQDGAIPASEISDATARILTEMFRFGVFNRVPSGTAGRQASTAADQTIGLQTAEAGAVLLQNDGGLPLPDTAGTTIEVLGSDSGAAVQTGPTASSSAYVDPPAITTPCSGLTAAAGAAAVSCDSSWDPTSQADADNQAQAEAAEAAAAGVAVVFVSVPAGEGADLSSLDLPDYQDTLVDAVAAAQPDTVVVVNSGNPVVMPWLSSVKSVVEDWFGGQSDGTAIAALLFGRTNFSGKLPMTFPTSASATPTSTPAQFPGINGKVQYSEGFDVGYRGYEADGITPEFPFGFGLSYTTFAFSPVTLSAADVVNGTFAPDPRAGASPPLATASTTVTNTGSVAGVEVAQLYVADPTSTGEQRQLVGYQRVALAPGASQTVTFPISARALSYWDTVSNGWVVADGTYDVYAGDSSALADLGAPAPLAVTASVGSRYATLAIPPGAAAGTTVTVTAAFHNDGDLPLYRAHFALLGPAAYDVKPTSPAPATVAPYSTVTQTFAVTVPSDAEGTSAPLTAQLRYSPAPTVPARLVLRSTGTLALPPIVANGIPAVVVDQDQQEPTAMTFTNAGRSPVTVHWTATPPPDSGITISPASGSVEVRRGTTTVPLQVGVSAAAVPGYEAVPIAVEGTMPGSPTYALPTATLGVTIAYPSLASAFDDVGVTQSDPSAGNFDGSGNSYSASVLAAAGVAPGQSVEAGGLYFTWPAAGPDVSDDVLAAGQVITVQGQGSQLGLLCAATGGNVTSTVTIRYADGTSTTVPVTMTNWTAGSPVAANTLVASGPEQRTDGGSPQRVSLFELNVPVNPSVPIAQVVLPLPPPNRTMHVFAIALG